MFVLYCFCLIISTVVKTEIMNPPPNVAVMEGDRVVLECGSDGTVEKWYLKRPLNSMELVIYSNTTLNRSLGGMYSINKLARNETDLVIASTTLSEAGTYYCQDHESISTAEVIVFGLMTDCNPKGNTVDSSLSTNSPNPALLGGFTSLGGTIACVSYNGQWPPTIQCSNPTEGVNRSAEILKSFPMNDSTLVVFRISNESKISRESYKCEAFFLESSRPPRASGDCPELELRWVVRSTTTSSMPRDYRASVSLLVVMLSISAWWSICIRTDQNIQ